MRSVLMVFSHPNHEIALLGAIDRLKPDIVFLTDGGGADRVAQSRQALASYLEPNKLHFLNHSEASFYDAMVDRDAAFYRSVSQEVRAIAASVEPDEVYCDAVEFYNPVHDIALPIVHAAFGGRHDVAIYEVPLIHQSADHGALEMQRVPRSLEPDCVWVDLTETELSRKTATLRAGHYKALFGQLGDAILSAIPSHARHEQVLPARTALPRPASDQAIRYDERGRTLLSEGAVRAAISYRRHYTPLYEALCA